MADLNSGHLSNLLILASFTETVMFLGRSDVLSLIEDRLRMFMTVRKLAFIPDKSLRACSLNAASIYRFSTYPFPFGHSAARPDAQHAHLAGKT